MQNDKSQPGDLDTEKDFDAVDADFSDESWDEFDDAPSGKASEADTSTPSLKKKTFVQKYFNFIVIGVVLVGGILFLLGRSGTAVQSTIVAQDGSEVADMATPPMPTPIDSAPADISEASANPEGAAAPSASADTLTPLPMPQESSQTELQAPVELPPVAPPAEPKIASLESDGSPDAAAVPVEPVINDTPPAALPPEAHLSETPQELAPPPVAMPAPVNNAELDNVNSKIGTLEQNIAQIRSDMDSKNSETNKKIDSLAASLKSLEQTLNQKMSSISAAPAKAAEPAPAPKPEEKKEVLSQKNDAKPASSTAAYKPPKPTSAQPVQWVLRSAGPGWARLSPQGSNEMRAISVGEQVEGLGKITSIAIENGAWTVRGTRGSLSR